MVLVAVVVLVSLLVLVTLVVVLVVLVGVASGGDIGAINVATTAVPAFSQSQMDCKVSIIFQQNLVYGFNFPRSVF